MVLGFNHNVRYKGEIFHIQTEDSGLANPHIITLVYRGGTILGSKKTSYADIIKIENLEQVVEELMKEQHKEMLRRLKSGEFDSRAFPGEAPAAPAAPPAQAPPKPASPAPAPPPPNSPPASATPQEQPAGQSLDEIILDYLTSGEE